MCLADVPYGSRMVGHQSLQEVATCFVGLKSQGPVVQTFDLGWGRYYNEVNLVRWCSCGRRCCWCFRVSRVVEKRQREAAAVSYRQSACRA